MTQKEIEVLKIEIEIAKAKVRIKSIYVEYLRSLWKILDNHQKKLEEIFG